MMNSTRHEDTSPSYVNNYLSEGRPKRYSSIELKSFTSDFSESNSIGSGGFAEVYKGVFPGGELRAVKVLNKMNCVEHTFMAEVRTMENIAHRNLVKLCGYCFEENMKALVYEYMENGSLDKILYEDHHGNIEWAKLYDIVIDIANGLQYLHHGLVEQIIHHDIKAANVLLDKNFLAKIADFGLARIMKRDVSRVDLSQTRGTPGYNAPETWRPQSQVTFKCDVYSFGMMLFEILGKRNNGEVENWFPGLVWNQFENGSLDHLITTDCGIAEKDKENATILCKVAFWCVQENPDLRPSMKNVVLMLEKEKLVENPPLPSCFREESDEMELDSTDRQNIIAHPTYPLVAESEGRVILRQLKSNKRKTLSPDRECSDKMELDPTHPKNIIAGPSHASIAGNDDGATLPQLKSNKSKTRSPNREEDLATLVPNKGMKFPTTKLVGESALKYKERILQLIAKDEVVTIGVHGMGGVGKTIIFKHAHNQLAEGKRFDKVIWVTVSQNGNITKLQNDLAKELHLELSSEDDVLRRSRLLLQALEKRKRVVFFFDDMWTKISLDEIGIPEPTQENGFKLILSTRLVDVCRTMGCHEDNTIKVEGLPKYEAWELFMNKVDCVLTPGVRKIAEKVVKKCSGLPLAIITVGATMRGNSDINKWKVILNDLNLKDSKNQTLDMEDNVYKCLKFSYDHLKNETHKKCFLCCALYPEDYNISTRDLVEFWIMDGLVEGRNREEERVNGQYILNELKDHCLLETVDYIIDVKGNPSDGVKMHDLIREMALRLTNKCFMVQNGSGLKELPKEKEWEIDLERASFMDSKITVVSISPICPKLSTLILGSTLLESVGHNFFAHMKCLKVLDLRCNTWWWRSPNNYLELLPDSISDLVNLRALRLSKLAIILKKLPSLAKLVSLRWLELNQTGIEELPQGMEMLVNLRSLNLHGVPLKKKIPMGLISKLSALEELYLGGIEIDKVYDIGSGESFAKELLSLKKLEILNVSLHCLSDYASYVGSSEFNGLKYLFLTIGEVFDGVHNQDVIPYGDDEDWDDDDMFVKPFVHQNTNHIDKTSLNMFGLLKKGVRELVQITIRDGNKIECIWSSKDENQEFTATATATGTSSCWLQSLESIYINGCTKLYTIFEGIPNYTSGVLPVFCLKELTISSCHNLKNVFPSSRMLQLLQNLEYISIKNCDELEELIGDDDEEEETETPIAIPRLKYLWIEYLPKLKSIWRGVVNASNCSQSLQTINIDGCTKLYTIFEGIPSYTSGVLPVFCLKELTISDCHNLKNVFPSSRMLQLLQNLEEITIMDCDELEELIGDDDEEEETETPIAIPRLKYLCICDLPKLKRIWRGVVNASNCSQSLQTINIKGCTKLYTIFEGIPSYTSGVLPVFCLKKLTISDCDNLKNVFPSSRMLQLLQNLEEITIMDCDELEELIGDDDEEEETETPIAIPRLKSLQLWNLPKLKRIWRGVMICDSLERIYVNNCSELRRLPQIMGVEQSTPPPALEEIKGGRKWWDSLEWDPAYPKNILQPFYREKPEYMCRPMLKMSEGGKSSQSDECALEGAGIDREECDLSDLIMSMIWCDNCKICPIVGNRYKCKDCWEERDFDSEGTIGYEFCEECYNNTPAKHSNLVNQHHTQGHSFELIANP